MLVSDRLTSSLLNHLMLINYVIVAYKKKVRRLVRKSAEEAFD